MNAVWAPWGALAILLVREIIVWLREQSRLNSVERLIRQAQRSVGVSVFGRLHDGTLELIVEKQRSVTRESATSDDPAR